MASTGRLAAIPAGRWCGMAVGLALAAIAGCGGGVNEGLTGSPNTSGTPASGGATPTVTLEGLSIKPSAATLFAGVGEPPLGCNGGVQSFVVTGDQPPFTVAADGGCLSDTIIGSSGDSFTFTAGKAGTSSIIVTDGLGDTATAIITVRNPSAAFLKVDLVPSERSDNGDGTFTSVVAAVLTDASGVAVADGVPVEFTLANPVAGVSLTSPGYTNQSPPCTAASAVAQPGDALSCIKYAQSLQGTTVTIDAQVQTAGGILEDEHTVTLPGSQPTPVPTAGQPAAMQFLGAQPATIGVRGSGLPQQSQLTFQVTDALGVPVQGVSVSFSLSEEADESISPNPGVTDAGGSVRLTLTSGERALSVQISAAVDSVTPPLVVQSAAVDILGAPPSQLHFAFKPQFLNISGRVTFGLENQLTAFVGDRFGNPVPPGTAVSFTSLGGVIGSPVTTTQLGQAVGTLVSQNPVPTGMDLDTLPGIVSTLATTHGERPFDDANHNGICDPGETVQAVSEPYYDSNCNGVYDEGEEYIDLNNNGMFDSDQLPAGQDAPACGDPITVFESVCTTFSAHTFVQLTSPEPAVVPAGGQRDYTLIISDSTDGISFDGNSIVGGSSVHIATQGRIKLLGPADFGIGDAQTLGQLVNGENIFQFSITDNQPDAPTPETDALIITVTSMGLPAGGNGNVTVTDVVTFLTQPTATPAFTSAPTNPPTLTFTPTPTVTPTPGQPAALRFVSATPVSIGVHNSGSVEQSTVVFQVTDTVGAPIAGVAVSFSLAPVTDETIAPAHAISDASGNVSVTLTSGERALSVQIIATVDANPALTVRSTPIDILGAPPSQLHFALAAQFLNISGQVTFGLLNQITAFVGDRFGNPVPPGTAVSFTTNGGVIGSPVTTNMLGQAVGTLVSQNPLPPGGIVATLATTHGERAFDDANHNGVCDPGETVQPVSEPFYDANCNGVYDEGEEFIDLNNNQQFDADQLPPGQSAPACGDPVVIFESLCTTFSAHTVVQLIPSSTGPIAAGGGRDYTLIVSDVDGNPIVGGSTVTITVQGRSKLIGPASFTIADAETLGQIVDGINRFQFAVADNAPTSPTSETDAVIVTVTSEGLPAGGNGSVAVTDSITFLAAPTPTPSAVPTPTPTGPPPAVVPQTATLAQGTGAPPVSCNGGSQTFVVVGGSPPFSVFGGGGCINVSTVAMSGGSFLYTAGNIPGDYTITVTDAAGRLAAAGITINAGPTATPVSTSTPTPSPRSSPTSSATPSASPTPTP